MKVFLPLAAAFALSLGALSAAADPVPAPVAPTAPTPSPDEQVVCKTVPVTGSRFPTRECRTKAEWAAVTAAAREFTDRATRPTCGVNCH